MPTCASRGLGAKQPPPCGAQQPPAHPSHAMAAAAATCRVARKGTAWAVHLRGHRLPPQLAAAAYRVDPWTVAVSLRDFAWAMHVCPQSKSLGAGCGEAEYAASVRADVAGAPSHVRFWWDAIVREARQNVIGVPVGHNFDTPATEEAVARALRRPGSAGGRQFVEWFLYLDAHPDDTAQTTHGALLALWDALSWFNLEPNGGADVGAVVMCALRPAGCVSPAYLARDTRATAFMRWLLGHRALFEAAAAAGTADPDLDGFVWV